ncbi:Endoribonuclease L-PSP superfamily [Verrucomicrobiia bacterium DG1235]|nr:Endoribonuclease L-PSP superfamily [Verrucomicrobiae bacterium DG1235]
MRIKAFFALLVLVGFTLPALSFSQGDEAEFREALYLSDVDRDQRTPQAVRVGGVVFVSAMSGPGATLQEQARSIYMRLQSVLGNYGMSMAEVAQERIYIRAGESYADASAARLAFFGEESAPASTLVEVAGFSDVGTLIEIEMIAVAGPE